MPFAYDILHDSEFRPKDKELGVLPLRIANILLSPYRGGLERAHVSLTELLQAEGHKVDVWLHPNSPYKQEIEQLSTSVYTLYAKGFYDPIATVKAHMLIRKTSPDALITHNSRATVLLNRARKLSNTKLIGFSHSNKLKKMLVADHLVAINPNMMNEMLQLGRTKENCSCIPNFLREIPPEPVNPGNRSLNKIAFVGRLDANKGLNTLLTAFSGLLSSGDNFELHIAGAGEAESALRAKASNLAIEDKLKLYDWVDDIQSWLVDKTLLVAPSRSESFGLVALDAAINGCPILASNVSGFASQITDGINGWLVEPNNADNLKERMSYILHLPVDEREIVAKRNYENVQNYSMENIAKKINTMLEKALL